MHSINDSVFNLQESIFIFVAIVSLATGCTRMYFEFFKFVVLKRCPTAKFENMFLMHKAR